MKNFLSLIFLLIGFNVFSQNAKILGVHDGDSYLVKFDSSSEKIYIRLYLVDCPEVRSNFITRDQEGGRMVADSMRNLLKGKRVTIDTLYRDIYNRPISLVYLDGLNINQYILEKGYGWYLTDKSKDVNPNYKKAYLKARRSKIGIWSNPNIISPSNFRKKYRY